MKTATESEIKTNATFSASTECESCVVSLFEKIFADCETSTLNDLLDSPTRSLKKINNFIEISHNFSTSFMNFSIQNSTTSYLNFN